MSTYTIEQTATGVILGSYEASDPDHAWALCCADAGYSQAQTKDDGVVIYATTAPDDGGQCWDCDAAPDKLHAPWCATVPHSRPLPHEIY